MTNRIVKSMLALAAMSAISGMSVAQTAAPRTPPRTPPPRIPNVIYVSATAAANGDGSFDNPFATLSQVESFSRPGDTIYVLPSPASVNPLDGGITLKPNQHLIGYGPSVLATAPPILDGGTPTRISAGLASVPALANSSGASHNGDAVTLAPGAEVANLVIKGSFRGGIYGLDALDIDVHGNDISGNNASGTTGFRVQPFFLEQYAAGVANHGANGIAAGWASILIDGQVATGAVRITGNYVHDGVCSDGIDIRAMGTSNLTATVEDNFVTRLIQCSAIGTLEGMGMQAIANGVLQVALNRNSQDSNGSPGANSDSLFTNIGGSGVVKQTIDLNAYRNGIGGASTNGFEFIIGDGVNADGEVVVSNSVFDTNPGDMLEEFNRGINSTAHLTLNNVTVRKTTISGGIPVYANPPGTAATPDNTGECLGIGSVGSFDHTILEMNETHFSGCGNNGLEVTNNHDQDDGGPDFPHTIDISIDHSSITGSKFYNLWINNVTPLTELKVKVQDSDLSGSLTGVAVAFDQQTTASTVMQSIDLGGGSLGSAGRNCFGGGFIYDLESTGYTVSAKNDWWGQATGPTSGKLAVSSGGVIADTPALDTMPEACEFQAGTAPTAPTAP